MQQTIINGSKLEYEVRGSGEPVLLISTGPIRDSFLPFLSDSRFVEHFQLIAYRQRRMVEGTSTPVTFAEHAADAAELLRHLGVRRAHVAGHSTGAAIALQLAVDHADKVHSLTLLEPPLLGVPSAGAFFEKAGPALAAYRSGDREAAMRAFLSMVCSLDWEACAGVVEKSIPGGVAQAIRDADNFFESYLPALGAWQFLPEQIAVVSQPILSVLGTDTEQLFVDSHEMLHAWFPRVEDCKIERAAHLLHMQRPEQVGTGIREFLGSHPIAAFVLK